MSNSRSGPSSGPYFVHIEGLPARYTWQDLKDLIRTQTTHGLWTDMQVLAPGRRPREGVGYARVSMQNEACQLYNWLTNTTIEGGDLRVHLWDISNANAARFLVCNCGHSRQSPPAAHNILHMAASLQWQPLQSTIPAAVPFTAPYQAVQPGTRMFVTDPIGMPLQQGRQQMAGAISQRMFDPQAALNQGYVMQRGQTQAAPLAVPAFNAAGMPVNMTYGGVRTEARGVYVSGLPYSASEKEIKNWFSQAGRIVEFRLNIDKTTKKSRGNCTIQYGSVAEAKRAIDIFDEKNFMNMKLHVRFDKAAKPVLQPSQSTGTTPTIVDSNRPYSRQIMAT